jgi:hypothetical protein
VPFFPYDYLLEIGEIWLESGVWRGYDVWKQHPDANWQLWDGVDVGEDYEEGAGTEVDGRL